MKVREDGIQSIKEGQILIYFEFFDLGYKEGRQRINEKVDKFCGGEMKEFYL